MGRAAPAPCRRTTRLPLCATGARVWISVSGNPAARKRAAMASAARVLSPEESVVLISMSCWKNADYFGAGAGGGGRGGNTGGALADSVWAAAGGHTDTGEEFEFLLSADDVPDGERGGEPGDVAVAAVTRLDRK